MRSRRKVSRRRLATKFLKQEGLRKELFDKFTNPSLYENNYKDEPCEICIVDEEPGAEVQYATFRALNDHVKKKHYKDYRFIRLKRFAARFRHITEAAHTQKPCDLCALDKNEENYYTYNLAQLYQHVLKQHEKRKAFMHSLIEKYLDKQNERDTHDTDDKHQWVCPVCYHEKDLFNLYASFRAFESHIKRDHRTVNISKYMSDDLLEDLRY